MKHDLDCLLQERGLDAALVAGAVHGNPAMYYMTNGAGLTSGFVLKKRDEEPLLLCWPMEREEAAASGLTVINLGVQVHGDFGVTPIDAARATKDPAEVEHIREMGRRTCAIVARTVEFLKSFRVQDEVLVQPDGAPLTVGRVHEEINRLLAEQRLEDPEGFIFSIGRDAGIPHSKGRPDDVIALGQTIVFDIFPCQAGGGYFFDMTRTFCLGYAPPEVEKAYQDVYECQRNLIEAYEVGTEAKRYQHQACEFFEDRGHPTIASDAKTEVGYVHTVGHGLGLAVHEEPRFSDVPTNTDVLKPGHVFTCEPGLYYPDRGFGMRIEDVIWIDPDGGVHNLTDFPKELVVEI